MAFLNHYQCEACDTTWDMQWSCTCDDRCPTCGVSHMPFAFEDLETTEDE